MAEKQIPEWTFGDRLRKARERAGLKQADMAARFRAGRSTIANWEAERNRPDYLALEKWAEITEVPIEWLEDSPKGGITSRYTRFLIGI